MSETCGNAPVGYAHRLACVDKPGHSGRHTSCEGFQWTGDDTQEGRDE